MKNIKHIGFKLDIGIYSPKKKRFVLGIEMDGTIYHKGHRKAFCDAQRQEILEMKGWEVYPGFGQVNYTSVPIKGIKII
ncbi:hypothetical protein AGMMS49573_07990 [Endomicrobiia bacterium]|nr:hypothetical protein AGMMS49532_02960 [Endomicrobiia bacterium]GHT16971.1 hypothetical protein AGMMS49573_07990 [Endomicrobiia bacterium]